MIGSVTATLLKTQDTWCEYKQAGTYVRGLSDDQYIYAENTPRGWAVMVMSYANQCIASSTINLQIDTATGMLDIDLKQKIKLMLNDLETLLRA